MYTKTLTAKRDYHLLVTNLLKENIEIQRLKDTYTAMCLERRHWYDQAKRDTMRQYADLKMSLLSYERFARLRTDTAVLLTCHTQQALYTLLQRSASYNWRRKPPQATDQRRPNTGTPPDKHDRLYTSYGNGHVSSGTPPCGKSRCSHYQNNKKRTGIQTNEKSH